ncbi:hypothetical protein DCO17_02900 [Polynucleobacter tropicus]|uniref:PilZ domain-containing protein n=1 Tax=Polynucleobacter tropicus TaxID=1743174 RepID=A0A6M9PWL1_9BURK|nr:hypothetical protein [Polynucleobacter tropicus]QKM64272.1 hypothetical protein DCO17_02900 [Polynucleobacter tropicus]
MRFNIFPPEGLQSIEPKFHVDTRLIQKTIERELHKKPLAGLYPIDGVGSAIPVSLLDVAKGLLVMKPETKPEGGFTSLIGGQRIVVMCGESGKMQFLATNLRLNEEGNLVCPMPADLILIQRRKEFRTLGPADDDLNFVLCLGAGQELLTKVIDISDHGILLDIRLGATEVEVGRYWHSGYFERLRSRSTTIDLVIKNVRPGADIDRIRAGCELYEPKKQTLKEFESTRSAIENARVQGRLNRWYLGASWHE